MSFRRPHATASTIGSRTRAPAPRLRPHPSSTSEIRSGLALGDQLSESSSLQTALVCLVTMWRGPARHEVGNPYTLCSMPKNEPHPDAMVILLRFGRIGKH